MAVVFYVIAMIVVVVSITIVTFGVSVVSVGGFLFYHRNLLSFMKNSRLNDDRKRKNKEEMKEGTSGGS